MKRWPLVEILVLLAVVVLVSCGGQSEGEKLLESRCDDCHSLDLITQDSKSAEGWQLTVNRMVMRGAKLDDGERQVLIDYLTETYP